MALAVIFRGEIQASHAQSGTIDLTRTLASLLSRHKHSDVGWLSSQGYIPPSRTLAGNNEVFSRICLQRY